jgi:hypothetical protein
MLKESEKRIQQLELSINILEEHLKKYGSKIDSKAYEFIQNQILNHKRELKIWKDFPMQEL